MIVLEVFTNLFELQELAEPLVHYAIAPAVIAAIGLAAQLGGSIYSGIKSKQANEEAKREADKLKREQDEMYRQQLAEAEMLKQTEGDFLNTALGKGLVTELQDQYNNAIKQGTSSGLKRELTDEAKQANVQTANRQYTDAMRGIAQTGTGYRMGILNMVNNLKHGAYSGKTAADMNYANFNIGMADAKNQSALNLGQNFNQIGSNLMNTAGKWDGVNKNNNVLNDNKIVNGMNNSQLNNNDLYETMMRLYHNKPKGNYFDLFSNKKQFSIE